MNYQTVLVKQFYLLSTGKVILENAQGDLFFCEEDPAYFRGGLGEEYDPAQLYSVDQLDDTENQELIRLLVSNAAIMSPLRVYAMETSGNLIIGHEAQPSLFVSMSSQDIAHLTAQDSAQLSTMIGTSTIATPHMGTIEQGTFIVL